ncbi:helix-turn-helix transcriptional regulator [Halostreptopolyspora alba]
MNGETPTLLLVDDLPMVDISSLRELAAFSYRLHRHPVGLAVSASTGEDGADPAILATLSSDPSCHRLVMDGMTVGVVGEMLRTRLGAPDAPFVSAVHHVTGGIPMFVEQLVRAAETLRWRPTAEFVDEVGRFGSLSIASTLLNRVQTGPPGTEDMLRALSVLRTCDPELAAATSGLDHNAASDALRSLQERGIIRIRPCVAFAHQVVATSIYQGLSAHQRQDLHTRAAASLCDRAGSAREAGLHLLRTSGPVSSWALTALREAAHHARGDGDLTGASAFLERALPYTTDGDARADVLLETGTTLLLADPWAALSRLREAHASAESIEVRVRTASTLADALARTQCHDAALRALSEVDEPHGPSVTGPHAALLRARIALHALGTADPVDIDATMRWPPETAPGDEAVETPHALVVLSLVAAMDGAVEDALRQSRRAMELAPGSVADPSPHVLLGILPLVWADELDEAAGQLVTLPEVAGLPRYGGAEVTIRELRALLHLRRGDIAEAVSSSERAMGMSEGARSRGPFVYSWAILSEAALESDDLERAESVLADHSAVADSPDPWEAATFHLRRGHLRHQAGETESALTDLHRCGRLLASHRGGRCPGFLDWKPIAAEAHALHGHHGSALDLAEDALNDAHRWGTPRTLGTALRALGIARLLMGVADGTGEDPLEHAARVLEEANHRVELARSLLTLGWARRRQNRKSRAREHLRRALAIARACGARRIAVEAASELSASGARRNQSGLSGDLLTSSERRVARAAAAGMTNRAISQQLFVTQRTVELHLTSIYRKLGISGRSQIPTHEWE